MPMITNTQVIDRLLAATQEDRIDWQPTGTKDQFSASFGGKWTVTVDRAVVIGSATRFWVELKDSEGESVTKITNEQNSNVAAIFEMARRHAFHIDERLADFLSELDKSKPEPR